MRYLDSQPMQYWIGPNAVSVLYRIVRGPGAGSQHFGNRITTKERVKTNVKQQHPKRIQKGLKHGPTSTNNDALDRNRLLARAA